MTYFALHSATLPTAAGLVEQTVSPVLARGHPKRFDAAFPIGDQARIVVVAVIGSGGVVCGVGGVVGAGSRLAVVDGVGNVFDDSRRCRLQFLARTAGIDFSSSFK